MEDDGHVASPGTLMTTMIMIMMIRIMMIITKMIMIMMMMMMTCLSRYSVCAPPAPPSQESATCSSFAKSG